MKPKEILLSIIMLLIGGSVTYFFETAKIKSNNQKRYIEFDFKRNIEVFSKPNISNKKISVLLDEKPVEQISQLTIPLYNLINNNDLKDLKIYFDLYNLNGDSIKLVNTSLTRGDNATDGISAINSLNPSSYKGGMKKGFSVSSLNRGENLTPSLYANFYFEGTSVPECNVFVDQPDIKDQPGVEARLFDYNNFIKWYDSAWGIAMIVLFFVILYFLIVLIVVRLLSFFTKKRFKRKRKERENYIVENFKAIENELLLAKPEEIVKEIMFIGRKYDWEHSSKFDRLVSNLKKPQKD